MAPDTAGSHDYIEIGDDFEIRRESAHIEWAREDNVTCVVCPGCAFAFDAIHHDEDADTYTCPLCGATNGA